jgi:CubicO group peptidase (beta-lactamase class C family)
MTHDRAVPRPLPGHQPACGNPSTNRAAGNGRGANTVLFRSLLLVGVALLSIGGLTEGQTRSGRVSPALGKAAPAEVGLSMERLTRIERMLEEAIEEQKIPGAVALVARKGKIVWHKAFGEADQQAGRPLEGDAIFRIASQTKAITATAVMMLWEEGRFRLDDPVSKFLPEFKEMGVLQSYREEDGSWTTEPARRPITIRHLLTHTSGLGYGVIDRDPRFQQIYRKAGVVDLYTTEPITIAESVRRLARLPLHHHPGEKYTYSEGLDVLGYFVEVLSGMPFDRFLEERLFRPLGMNDTAFYLPAEKAPRLVRVQKRENGRWIPYPVTFYDPDYPIKGARTFFSGGAGLCSTARDYATFLQMYLNGGELGGRRFLSRTTIATIMSPQMSRDYWTNENAQYGLAFGLVTERGVASGGEGSVGTFDWGGYFNTQFFADPQEGVIGILMKQTRDAAEDETGWRFRLLVGQSIDD